MATLEKKSVESIILIDILYSVRGHEKKYFYKSINFIRHVAGYSFQDKGLFKM